MAEIDVMLYALSTCPFCRKTKEFLNGQGVKYHFLDVDTAAEPDRERAKAEVMKLAGSLQFPVVVINGQVVQGYDVDQISYLLSMAGWERR